MTTRIASHAGSWYVSSREDLDRQLVGWLNNAQKVGNQIRAIISPHAGYSYCGSSAAHAYRQIEHENIKRIFILGPSHHVYLPGCALSSVQKYETPLYSLTIDQAIYAELKQTNKFTSMTKQVDEDEHSIEMQLPYIAKVMEKCKDKFTIVPVLVGGLDRDAEKLYGEIFSSYLADPQNLFVISSDFCHWGQRFKYTYFDEKYGEIYKSIEHLDKMGMKFIEELDATKFHKYLKQYGNTICGRHPIGVLLNAVEALQNQSQPKFTFKFLDYKQSSKCKHQRDSSVSYAAGVLENV
ncbi:protein MEMO1-like [Styela clava]